MRKSAVALCAVAGCLVIPAWAAQKKTPVAAAKIKNSAEVVKKSPLVDLKTYKSPIVVDLAMLKKSNFMGRKAAGYRGNVCGLMPKTAEALVKAQSLLTAADRSLLLYVTECHRSAEAVQDFRTWAETTSAANLTKADMSARQLKIFADERLFDGNIFRPLVMYEIGYLAKFSNHSYGNAVDVTIVRKGWGLSFLDMGTEIDTFSKVAYRNAAVSPTAAANRRLLYNIMDEAGFNSIPTEWWHFEL